MTSDKAREYFSAHHEGTLEPGLRASFERKIAADAALKAEYDAFTETIGVLNALRFETIESPSYLSDRIATRLESARETTTVPFWVQWFGARPVNQQANPRFVWAMGLSACLLLAAIGLRGMESAEAMPAAIWNGEGTGTVKWTKADGGVTATFKGGPARELSVVPEGGEPQSYRLASQQGLVVTLSNPNSSAHRFTVMSGKETVAMVVLPGTRPVPKKPGSGTMDEFATAVANAYRIPVVVKGAPESETVKWSFESLEVRKAAEEALDGHGSASVMGGDVLEIVR
ncbi:hypothetical protein EON82_04945 [bacterium]|nr:MAG: hypothetical protein EON82_04945 [bacterium]